MSACPSSLSVATSTTHGPAPPAARRASAKAASKAAPRARVRVRDAKAAAEGRKVVRVRRVKVGAVDVVVARDGQEAEDAAAVVVEDDDGERRVRLAQRVERVQVVQRREVADEQRAAAAAAQRHADGRVQDAVDAAGAAVAQHERRGRAVAVNVPDGQRVGGEQQLVVRVSERGAEAACDPRLADRRGWLLSASAC